MNLSDHERGILSGASGPEGARMAMEVVVEAARMMGADRLVPIVSSHIDGCLYHGDAGVLYCERLADEGARVAVPATTNVGSLNLLQADQVKLPEAQRGMALRLMTAHRRMGLHPELDLRTLPDAGSPRAGPADRLGRIECGRLRQHCRGRANEPLRRLPGPRLRNCGAGALLRAALPGEAGGKAVVRGLGTAGSAAA